AAGGAQSNARRTRIAAIPLFQRSLQRSDIHNSLPETPVIITAHYPETRSQPILLRFYGAIHGHTVRRVRNTVPARGWRDGRSVPRAGQPSRTRSGTQSPVRRTGL